MSRAITRGIPEHAGAAPGAFQRFALEAKRKRLDHAAAGSFARCFVDRKGALLVASCEGSGLPTQTGFWLADE